MSERRDYVFGYGSLLSRASSAAQAPARECQLRDHRRVWNVAMDNGVDLPAYKHYLDEHALSRPAVFVTFLNLVPAPGEAVNGVLFAVGAEELRALDRRERNYERVAIGELLDEPVGGTAWTYVGRRGARARFDAALGAGTAVVDAHYLQHVRDGFAQLGADALARFERSTDAPCCPVVPLRRVDT